jgi:hypothetical protein
MVLRCRIVVWFSLNIAGGINIPTGKRGGEGGGWLAMPSNREGHKKRGLAPPFFYHDFGSRLEAKTEISAGGQAIGAGALVAG